MIDIHCHILPGLDDGAKNMDEALDMADIAVESGVTCICATPHTNQEGYYENFESEEVRDIFSSLEEAIEKERIPLKLVRGAELFANDRLIQRIEKGKITSINTSDYYLVEFSFDEPDWYIEQTLYGFRDIKKIPIIAHPERYYCVQDRPTLLYEWMEMGVLSQVNKGSILGRFGPRTEKCADQLLDHCLVTCIASDAHNPFVRTTDMKRIDHYIRRHYSEEHAHMLLNVNPECIIHNQALPKQLPRVSFENKRFFW